MPGQKVALITGCSSGIGLHCAQVLARRPHWRVFAAARQRQDVDRLRQAGLDSLLLDLANSAQIGEATRHVVAQAGRIDALFNNGAYGQPGAVEDLPRHALQAQFEANVFGTQELTNAVIAVMRKQGDGGRIVQNSSVLGFVPLAYRGAYVASKYALEGLTDTMRLELAGSGICVILIEPGPIASRFRINANAKFREFFNAAAIAASPHRKQYESRLLNEGGGGDSRFTLPPQAVYRALLHALESPRPKLRYRVTFPTSVLWWAKRALPTACLDALLRRAG